jgi:excisionase family DNA binding protein
MSSSSRRIVTQQQAAQVIGVHVRTIRNWISQGIITGYRLPGPRARAIRVDLNEIEDQLKVMPAGFGPRGKPFGPKARLVTLVEEYRPATDVNGAATPTQVAQDADQDQTEASEAAR